MSAIVILYLEFWIEEVGVWDTRIKYAMQVIWFDFLGLVTLVTLNSK